MKRQKVRRLFTLLTLLLFPIVMNYLSPYLIVMGATEGIINGSFVVFILLFLAAMVFGRGYCGWVCPAAFLQEACIPIKDKPVNKRYDKIKYIIWVAWLGIIATFAIKAGGYTKIDFLYMTENVISIDSPVKYIIYYGVLMIFLALPLLAGRRAGCHTVCWMAPYMVIGNKLSRGLKLPSLQLAAEKEQCIGCRQCDKKCPMGLEVSTMAAAGAMYNNECVLCGECVDVCPKGVIQYNFGTTIKAKAGAKL